MLAIARELRLKGHESNVSRHTDSPTICFRKDGRISKQLTFVDSILQHGSEISPEDVAKARRVAGTSFIGQMEQYFLVIKETGIMQSVPIPSGTFHRQGFDLQRTNGNGGRGRGMTTRPSRGRGRGRGSNYTPIGTRKLSTRDLQGTENSIINNGFQVNHQGQQHQPLQGQVLYSQAVQMAPTNVNLQPDNKVTFVTRKSKYSLSPEN